MRDVRPPKWRCGVALYRRPLTTTRVRFGDEELPVRIASGLTITRPGDYPVEVTVHPSGRFAIASAQDRATDPAFGGGRRLRPIGLVPPPSVLAKSGYTKSWLEEQVGGNDKRRAVSRHITFGFKQSDVWWNDPHGNIVTRLPGLGCPVHLMGIQSIEQWEETGGRLTIVLLGDRPHALAFLPHETNGKSRITRVEKELGGVSHLSIIDPSTVVDAAQEEVEDLKVELAAYEYAGDDAQAEQVGARIQALTPGLPLSTPGDIVSRTPSAEMLRRIRGAKHGSTKKKESKSPSVSAAPATPKPTDETHLKVTVEKLVKGKGNPVPEQDKSTSSDVPLESVAGVGIKRAGKLRAAGIPNARKLRRTSLKKIMEALGCSEDAAKLIRDNAGQADSKGKSKLTLSAPKQNS